MLTLTHHFRTLAKAFAAFTEDGRISPSALYDRLAGAMEELFKCTLLTRDVSRYVVDR